MIWSKLTNILLESSPNTYILMITIIVSNRVADGALKLMRESRLDVKGLEVEFIFS